MYLDDTDRRILLALDADPRMTVLLLAERTGLARGTVQARLERLRESGVLRAHSARVDPASVGRAVAGHVAVELDQHRIDDAVEALRAIPEVVECHAPAGDTDLLVRVVATDPEDLYRVSELVRLSPGVVRTSTTIYLREVIGYRADRLLAADLAVGQRPRDPRRDGRR